MKIKNIAFSALLVAAVSVLSSCNEFLEKDPSKSTQRTIETADQLDALLGTFSRFYSEYNHTALACDDFGLTTDIHDHQSGGMSPSNLEYILWNDECTTASRLLWGNEYSKIYYANLVLAYIDEQYMEDLHCSDCAVRFSMSQSNIARLFKKYLNTSFTGYLNDVRIRKAVEMLEDGVRIE